MANVTAALAQVFSFFRPCAAPPGALTDEIGVPGAATVAVSDAEAGQILLPSSPSSAPSSPVPTFEEPTEDGGERRLPPLLEVDPSSFLIERMEREWFTDNIMRGCHRGWWWWGREEAAMGPRPHGSPDPPRNSSEASKFIDAEPNSPAGAGAGGARLRSIEMVQPLAGPSHQRDWDSRGLPGSRLRRLSRAEDGEPGAPPPRKAAVSGLRSYRSEDMSGAFARFNNRGREVGEICAIAERPSASGEDAPPAAFSERERRRPGMGDGLFIPAHPARRRRKDRRKSSRSSTDEEYDELRGFIDLGFNFDSEDLAPRVVDLLPGLKSYRSGEHDLHDLLESPRGGRSSPRTARTHSPRGWPTRPEPPLLNWHIPSSQDGTVDMKAHLKFWAHSVASSVSAEC